MSQPQGRRNREVEAGTLPPDRAAFARCPRSFLLLLAACCLTGCAGKKLHLASDQQQQRAHDKLVQQGRSVEAGEEESSGFSLVGWFQDVCNGDLFHKKPSATPPADSLVLRGDQVETGRTAAKGTAEAELAPARELFRQGQLAAAEKAFRRVANNTKNPPHVAEEARFYEAECLYFQKHFPKAADTYHKLLTDFPSSGYRPEATQRMFDIADWWLDDSRKQMQQVREQREGKRWLVEPNFFHWTKSKPFMDIEGRALEKLEQVRFHDITGPLADRALFMMGGVNFFNEDYVEADHNFSQLVEMHPNSPLAPQAVELAIISKHMSTGGADYDGRKVAEARQLVHTALQSYPELARQKTDFLQRQLIGITLQQAEKDYKIGEFYRRTGHPCSAWFYYEIVRRRYPGTKYFDLATERMHEIKAKVEKEQGSAALPVPPSQPRVPGEPPAAETAPPPRRLFGLTETAPQPRRLFNPPETAPAPRPLPGGLP